eukprot:CAMPEP_0114384626 /NCGR_PEP_ID=MMETSP0102-20121206/5475_1 /TAXON_ID=38822 ORGANISM="Pteridomonas danica, Strain PT" /NCGR_SAMPLE_ID=MMETSP0102 /ASSEMBLY_ACC=CAM_ASM_000212 /LENGTH=354 /DNA_ID=CAMNT_0001540971 /DNA_START=18 /DNA_END=1079 /DNA_ORIENTATION=-
MSKTYLGDTFIWGEFDRAAVEYDLKYNQQKECLKRSTSEDCGDSQPIVTRIDSKTRKTEETTHFTVTHNFQRIIEDEFLPKPPEIVSIGEHKVSAIGLGTLPLGVEYSGGGRPSRNDAALSLIRQAIDDGVNFFDTADTYCIGPGDEHYCERLLGEVIASHPNGHQVVVATKAGMKRTGSTSRGWSPAYYTPQQLKKTILKSRSLLCGDSGIIGLWQFHHSDGFDLADSQAFLDQLDVIKQCMDEGIIQEVGLCNASVAHVKIAQDRIGKVASIQNHYNFWDRSAERPNPRLVTKINKNNLLPLCMEQGMAFLPHGVLGGHKCREGLLKLGQVSQLRNMAKKKGVSVEALYLSW